MRSFSLRIFILLWLYLRRKPVRVPREAQEAHPMGCMLIRTSTEYISLALLPLVACIDSTLLSLYLHIIIIIIMDLAFPHCMGFGFFQHRS